jgi:hypothetical protein
VSEVRGRGITVTIKYGKGYDETWVVFHGDQSEVRDDLTSFFGLERVSEAALTLSDLVVNATSVAHGIGSLAAGLGATVIDASPAVTPASPPSSEAAEGGADPWVEAAAPPTAHPAAELLRDIADAPDVPALQLLWAQNQAAFKDEAVMRAWKTRGRQLSTAA